MVVDLTHRTRPGSLTPCPTGIRRRLGRGAVASLLVASLLLLSACSWRSEMREIADYGSLLRASDPGFSGVVETISLTGQNSDLPWRAYAHHFGPDQGEAGGFVDFFRLLGNSGEMDSLVNFFRLVGR